MIGSERLKGVIGSERLKDAKRNRRHLAERRRDLELCDRIAGTHGLTMPQPMFDRDVLEIRADREREERSK